jgi:hypothetical protein
MIGPHRVRFTLTRQQNHLEGVYFDANSLKDIPLRGRILGEDRLELTEFGEAGDASATIEGRFTGCERIAGTWNGGGKSLSFQLRQGAGVAGTLDQRYAVVGASDDELIHRNVRRFATAVAAGDRQTVASLVTYPLQCSLSGKRRTLRNRSEMLAH